MAVELVGGSLILGSTTKGVHRTTWPNSIPGPADYRGRIRKRRGAERVSNPSLQETGRLHKGYREMNMVRGAGSERGCRQYYFETLDIFLGMGDHLT